MNRRNTLGAMCGLAIALAARPLSAETFDGAFVALLAKYVKPSADGVNRVDYARWQVSAQDMASLTSATAPPARHPRCLATTPLPSGSISTTP